MASDNQKKVIEKEDESASSLANSLQGIVATTSPFDESHFGKDWDKEAMQETEYVQVKYSPNGK